MVRPDREQRQRHERWADLPDRPRADRDDDPRTVTREPQVGNSSDPFAYPSLTADSSSEIGLAVGVRVTNNNARSFGGS